MHHSFLRTAIGILIGLLSFSKVSYASCRHFVSDRSGVGIEKNQFFLPKKIREVLSDDQMKHYDVWERFALRNLGLETTDLVVPAPEWHGFFSQLKNQFVRQKSILRNKNILLKAQKAELVHKASSTPDVLDSIWWLQKVIDAMDAVLSAERVTVENTLFFSALYVDIALLPKETTGLELSRHKEVLDFFQSGKDQLSLIFSDPEQFHEEAYMKIRDHFYVSGFPADLPVPTFEDLGKPDANGYLKFNQMIDTPFQYYGLFQLDDLIKWGKLEYDGQEHQGSGRLIGFVMHDQIHHKTNQVVTKELAKINSIEQVDKLENNHAVLLKIWRSAYPKDWDVGQVLDAETVFFHIRHEILDASYGSSEFEGETNSPSMKIIRAFMFYYNGSGSYGSFPRRYFKDGQLNRKDFGQFYLHHIPFDLERWKKTFDFMNKYFLAVWLKESS